MNKAEIVEELREISNRNEAYNAQTTKKSEMPFVVFPGRHVRVVGANEALVREAAREILAEGLTENEHNLLSYKALATLVYYVADMIE